jgi:hypothetical protein
LLLSRISALATLIAALIDSLCDANWEVLNLLLSNSFLLPAVYLGDLSPPPVWPDVGFLD